jgi:hypothetical protein
MLVECNVFLLQSPLHHHISIWHSWVRTKSETRKVTQRVQRWRSHWQTRAL